MRTANSNLSIVLVVAVGAATTWLWINRGSQPPPHPAPVTPVNSNTPAQPTVARTPVPGTSEKAENDEPTAAVTAVTPVIPVPHTDSTYQSMLAAAQTRPDNTRTEHDLIQERERFLATADDPDWARRTEQALWDFYRTHAENGGLQVTSVSCRSEGCEVQAAFALPTCSTPPCEDRGSRADPLGPLRGDWPGGLPLRRQLLIGQPVDSGPATLITYSREETPAAPTEP
jgi:hypothetical protein